MEPTAHGTCCNCSLAVPEASKSPASVAGLLRACGAASTGVMGEEGKPADVVPHHEGEEDQDADERGLVDLFLDGRLDVTAGDALNDKEEDETAVKDGHGQQVKNAEVETDGGGEFRNWPEALFCGVRHLLLDTNRTTHVFDGNVMGEQAFQNLDDEQRVVDIVLPRLLDGFAERQTDDPIRARFGLEADLKLLVAVNGAGEQRCDLQIERRTAA